MDLMFLKNPGVIFRASYWLILLDCIRLLQIVMCSQEPARTVNVLRTTLMKDDKTPDFTRVPSTSKLAGSVAWNMIGMMLPAVVAFFVIPFLIHEPHGLGKERFGVLILVWLLVGYFGIFDMGLGRAMTKMIAEKLSLRKEAEVPGIFWTAMSIAFLFGLLAAGLIGAISPWLAGTALKIPDALRHETMWAFFAAAVGMPFVVATVGLIGALEACRHFKLINCIRLPMGILVFVGPLCVLPFSHSLFAVVSLLILVRIIGCLAYFISCLIVLPAIRHSICWQRTEVWPLLGFGGWMTISNLTVPLMIHINKFLIGGLLSMGAVTYYATPLEAVIKLLGISRACVSVLFPAFVTGFTGSDSDPSELFERGMKYLMLAMFPVVLVTVVFTPEILEFWLGMEFSINSSFVMRSIAIGIFIHGIARVPWFLIQSAGRPDLSAKVHLGEVPLCLAAASILIKLYGIQGAAIAWIIWAVFDLVVISIISMRFVSGGAMIMKRTGLVALCSLSVFISAIYPESVLLRTGVGFSGLLIFYLMVWRLILTHDERHGLVNSVKSHLPGLW